MNTKKPSPAESHWSKLARPAQRALNNAGISSPEQLAQHAEHDISELHGIGKNALVVLKDILAQHDLTFKTK